MMRDFGRALDLFERTVNGESHARAGSVYGIGRSRVDQIVRWTASVLLNPQRLHGDVPPDHDCYKVAERRQHADFWRRQIEKARAEMGKPADEVKS